MALNAPSFIPQPWATSGQAATIPNQKPEFGRASWSQGFPTETSIPLNAGGIPPNYLDFQGVLKILSQFAFFQQSGGLFTWSSSLDYLKGCHILGSNGNEYVALRPSGPNVPSENGGFVGPVDPVSDTGGYWRIVDTAPKELYTLGEFYYFRHPTMKPGFAAAQGGLISGAYQGKDITEYPIWEYLQTADGQLLLKTEAEWQAMTTAIWHTNADGTTVGWDGIGGAPYYVQDLGAGTLRMPDLRGMYAEAVGFDSLGVGGARGDQGRRLYGKFMTYTWNDWTASGIISKKPLSSGMFVDRNRLDALDTEMTVDSGFVSPTGTAFAPRRWGALACCYLGRPA